MALKTVALCDKARCQREAETYLITLPGEQVARAVDLCHDHSKILRDLTANARKEPLPARRAKPFVVTPIKGE